ncbi:TetR/AcrR family transcriptional regulator [Actinomadura rupiterrae]|uniref:TetR/AcrR family transcriptional regulator n=1 Tax=Actinomadura rupiterrae TaxID=559627 RepID=UPI0020A2991A|nr:TetR/AcrR family transcriptional regulator [Actinomadura rupiterrae]MCP2340007.1 AcrR family transcriptional regulator [Actinomadura rupiterrae]
MTGQRGPGRPRSEAARRAILDAAIGELQERGYGALTMQGIAARAGVGKQTVYRWWPSRADVVLEAVIEWADEAVALPDTGSLEDDLDAFLAATFRQRGQRPLLLGLMAEALLDPAFATQFRDRFLFARRAAFRSILDRAAARGEVAPDADPELLMDVVYGVLWYRLMLDHAPIDDELGRRLSRLVAREAAAPKPP